MNKKYLFELYEKLYFHEMEVRERITNRVQITFALVATGYTILSYMMRMLDYTVINLATNIFIIATGITFILSIMCLYFLVRAFWGNTYEGMPSPVQTDLYRENLKSHKKSIEQYNKKYPKNKQQKINVDSSIYEHLYQKFRDCSTHNTEVNDRRSKQLHQAFKWLLFAAIPMLVSSVTFIIYDLDVSSPRKKPPNDNLSVTTELRAIKLELRKLNLPTTIGVEIVPEIDYVSAPPPPQPPQEPETRPLVEHDGPLPTAGE